MRRRSRSLRRRFYGPFLPLALLIAVTLAGGWINSVDARGRIVDDTTDAPVPGIAVTYGSRSVLTGPDGSYVMTALPRGARLSAQRPGYGRASAPAEASVMRLVPLTITFRVKDESTGKGVDSPQARQPVQVRIATGDASGEMAVAPYPARDRPVVICANGYEPREVTARGALMEVLLKPGGVGCPPLPSPAPPVESPSPRPPAASPTGR